MNLRHHLSRFTCLVILIFMLKLLLAGLTPLGDDFVAYMASIIMNDPTFLWSPWIIVAHSIYTAWLWLPLEHGDPVLTLLASRPIASDYLLAILVKAPLILADLATAVIVRRLCTVFGSNALSRRATLLWLANPFTTFFVEMWGSIDILLVAFTLASVLMAVSSRRGIRMAASVPLALATAIRLSPIAVWPAIVIWLARKRGSTRESAAMVLAGPVGIIGYFYWLTQGHFDPSLLYSLSVSPLVTAYTPVTQIFTEYLLQESFMILGVSVIVMLGFYFFASEVWPKDGWSLISLIAAAFLLLYAFAVWTATAFLWAMPYLALWHAKNQGKLKYLALYLLSMVGYILYFTYYQITTKSSSVLFIPRTIVPYDKVLVAAIQSNFLIYIPYGDAAVGSCFAGVAMTYAIMITWKTLMEKPV